jgi:hypothetical protein
MRKIYLTRIRVCLFTILVFVSTVVLANTYTVTSLTDHPVSGAGISVNASTGMITGGSGNGLVTLRSAIIASNNNAGADVISLVNGTYLLSITSGGGYENSALTGDLDINGSLTINGNGAANTIISTNYTSACGDCKVIGVNQTGGFGGLTVSLNGITIQNGYNNGAGFAGTFYETGGGIDFFLTTPGTSYSMTNCIVKNNVVTGSHLSHGGGINADGNYQATQTGANIGLVTLTNVTVTGNTSSTVGGGMYLGADKHDVTMTNCTVTGNTATKDGGGIKISHSFGGTVNISGGSVSNNAGSEGGGLSIAGNQITNVNVSNTTVSNNTATNHGGGVYIISGTVNV